MKRIFVVLIILFFVSGCSIGSNKDNSEYVLNSNDIRDELALKVNIDYINVRSESNIDSNKVGVVKKDSVFKILDYSSDDKYTWFHINSDNIDGYIASEIEEPYVSILNGEIDIEKPKLTLTTDIIEIKKHDEINLESIKKYISYSDNTDEKPSIELIPNYDIKQGNNSYQMEIKVSDKSGNSVSKIVIIKIIGEKLMSDKKWLSYNEIIKLQNKTQSICSRYGFKANIDRGCAVVGNSYIITIRSTYIRIMTTPQESYCDYDLDLKVTVCEDSKGNDVNHDIMSESFKNIEKVWIEKIDKFLRDVKNTTGYDYKELEWNVN